MKRLLVATLLITTFSAMISLPAQAEQEQLVSQSDQLLLPTSNALPLLETDSVGGKITNIEGNQVQVALPNGETQSYRISASRQQQYGLQVGSELVLRVRRLNNAVIAITEVEPTAQQQAPLDVSQQ